MSILHRQGVGPEFMYVDAAGKRVTSPKILAYIKSLVIPPKYTNVRIHMATGPSGDPCAPAKLTYTGVDPAGRTQYGYSAAWKAKAAKLKFRDLIAFGAILPRIRLAVTTLLEKRQDPPTLEYCIALIVRIVVMCHFRLGNIKYKDLYKSYGVSTIEARHVRIIAPDKMRIAFIGKKGVKNDCVITDRELISHISGLLGRAAGPKSPLFVYFTDSDNDPTPVRAADVNEWMHQFGVDITSKMFRTYATNIMLIEQLGAIAPADFATISIAARVKLLNATLDEVSGAVHNTRAVCKGQYAHPALVDMWLNHPRAFKARFMGAVEPEAAFLTFLRSGVRAE
jgi:DNA topoisomerase-1